MWLTLVVAAILLMVAQPESIGRSRHRGFCMFPIVSGVLLTIVAVRFGLLPLVVTLFVWNVLTDVPMTLEVSHWSAAASNWTLAGLVALALFGFYASRAGQPLFGSILKD